MMKSLEVKQTEVRWARKGGKAFVAKLIAILALLVLFVALTRDK